MQTALFYVLLGFLAAQSCSAAVTWRTIGCGPDWTFDGKTMDEMWDNAIEMTVQAQAQIASIPTFSVNRFTNVKRKLAGANAQFLFNVNFKKNTGLNSAGKATMKEVNDMYTKIREGLQGTLAGLDPKNSFLFCGGHGLVDGPIPGKTEAEGDPFWHAELMDGDQKEYIGLAGFVTTRGPKPCTEPKGSRYSGKTFTATRFVNGERTEMNAIIICANTWTEDKYPVSATRELGFATEPYEDDTHKDDYPYAGEYNSIAGTLVHEMVHVVARTTRNSAIRDYENGSGFKQCAILAEGNQQNALDNPDNYRIFAEMNMSPDTVWGMPNPDRTTRAPLKVTPTPAPNRKGK